MEDKKSQKQMASSKQNNKLPVELYVAVATIVLFILGLIVLAGLITFYVSKSKVYIDEDELISDNETGEPEVCFDDKCYRVEIADTSIERQQGLMNRESMPKDQGMLFIFDWEGTYSVWMKNTLIPLDIIWIDDEKTIIDIKSSFVPCEKDPCPSYQPIGTARYFLELNAGQAAESQLQIGDFVIFKEIN